MADQDYTFDEGIDPTATWGIYASVLLQMIREAVPNSYRGMIIYSDSTPSVTGDYAWHKRCTWINTTDWYLYLYNDDLASWVNTSASIADGAINRTQMLANQIVTTAKLKGTSAYKLWRTSADGITVEEVTFSSLLTAGSVPLTALPTVTAYKVLGSIAGGTVSEVNFVDVFINAIPDVPNGSIPVETLVEGSAGQILSTLSGVAVWTTPTYAFADNSIPQSKIKTQTTVLTCATTVTVDASIGDNFLLTLTANVTTFTITNLVPGKTIQIKIKQDGTGGRTVGFSGINWPASTAPTITTTAGHADIISVTAFDTTLHGAFIQDYAS